MIALSHRLQQARERLFVGRTPQIDRFAQALKCENWSGAVWHLHGIGGIGKTSLLQHWKWQAQAANVVVIGLDARDFEPNVSAFCQALGAATNEILGVDFDAPARIQTLVAAWSQAPNRVILQLDTVELLAPLDYFLREKFVPLLPENTILMLAGRDALSLGWRADAALWNEVISFDLDAFSQVESENYLRKRGIDAALQPQFLEWTHGHPLALSLAADVWQQQAGILGANSVENAGENASALYDLPQLVAPLLDHLRRHVPTPAHRAALEACAIARAMTQELLAVMLEDLPGVAGAQKPDFDALFEWLRGLSMMQSQRDGVFPHDIARELLTADLRFRTPEWHGELHRRARGFYLQRIHATRGAEQERAIFNCIYLHRLSPVVGPYLRWNDTGLALETARADDFPALLAMVERHEGAVARAIAEKCFAEQPRGAIVVREPDGQVQGFVFQLGLERASRELLELDEAARRARDWLGRQAPLREGEIATMFRFWMDKDGYQGVGAAQSLIFVQAVRHYITTPHLAFTFFPCAEPQFWCDGFAYADVGRVPDLDFTLGKREFGVFGHDWRARPVLSWLDLLSQREMQTTSPAPHAPALENGCNFEILSDAEWLAATHAALRSSGDAATLRRSPLLKTALVHRQARRGGSSDGGEGAASVEARVLALSALLRQAIADLKASPRGAKAYRALELSFGSRALTQEAAATVMDVSHSSLRRYLNAGIERVAALLQDREMMGEENEAFAVNNEHDLSWF